MATVTEPVESAESSAAGNPTAFKFFFWGEFAERCSYYGMRAILALYMTDKLGVDKGDAGTYMSLFIAACYFFPLAGGYIADNFLGKYWTIVLFSVPYVVAQFLVGVENRYVVFGALVLLAMGSGVIKPNITTLMGLTYEQQRPGRKQLLTDAFSWFYMAINIGALLSQFAMPRLRTAYGYQVAFLFPAGLMAAALIIFALGKRFYGKESITRKVDASGPVPPEGRTTTGLPIIYQPQTAAEIAEDKKLKRDTLARIGALFLTIMFFWAIFDQSASTWIFFADTYMDCTLFGRPTPADSIQAFNALFIVILVPLFVALFRAFPLRATTKMGIGFAFTSLSMVIMAFAGLQAGAASKQLRLTTAEGATVLAYDGTPLDQFPADGPVISTEGAKYNPETKKLEIAGLMLVKLGDGRVLKVSGGHLGTPPDAKSLEGTPVLEGVYKTGEELASVSPEPGTAKLEVIDWVKPSERVTVWWQVLAFFIITVAEILVSVTGLELAFRAAPQSMKSFVTGCFLAVVGVANLFINAPFTQLYPKLPPATYFAVLAGAVGLVIVAFIPIASKFNRMMADAPDPAAPARTAG